MIYTPRESDAQLLSFSRELVRDALEVLRNSEPMAWAQRARDALIKAVAAGGDGDPA